MILEIKPEQTWNSCFLDRQLVGLQNITEG